MLHALAAMPQVLQPCASDHAPATMLQRHRAPATILQRVVLLDPKNTEFEVGMMKLITA